MNVWEECKFREEYERELQYCESVIRKDLDRFVGKYPHVSNHNYYSAEENVLWTSSFYVGMCWLAYEHSKDPAFISHAKEHLDSFENRLENRIGMDHDLGFLYTLTCVADYKLTGDQRAEKIAREAADVLAARYNEKGQYIQAWGDMDLKYPDVKIIIDTMLNLPLLYWTGEDDKIRIAKNHANTASHTLVRPDFSSYHTYLMDPDTGKPVCGKTHQGYADESTWARGQAWTVYGFALSYRYTKEKRFYDVARGAAEVFHKNLPADSVPYWDFTFSDSNPDIRDTSAAAIYVCGLLELCNYVSREEAAAYLKEAETIMKSLRENYSTKGLENSDGLLTEGMYHRHEGAEECTIWGDYFYMEALLRLTGDHKIYW